MLKSKNALENRKVECKTHRTEGQLRVQCEKVWKVSVFEEKFLANDRISNLQVFTWCSSLLFYYLGKGEYLFLCYPGFILAVRLLFCFQFASIAHGQQIKQFTFERETATDANAFYFTFLFVIPPSLREQNQFLGSAVYNFLCLPFGVFSRTFLIFIFICPAADTHLFPYFLLFFFFFVFDHFPYRFS